MPQRSGLTIAGRALIGAVDPAAPKKPRTFRMIANTGEPMRIWPWDSPVVVDLASIDLSGLPVPALYDHYPDIDFAVGQVTAVAIEGGQLVASGVFTPTDGGNPDRNYARKVIDKADAGYVWQVSVGGDPKVVEEVKAGTSVDVNGRTYAGPVTVARGVTLREISFVVLGGDRRTSAVVSRSRRKPVRIKGAAMPTFEDWVASLGFDAASLTDQQRAALQIQYDEKYGATESETPAETVAEGETAPVEDEEVAAEGETVPEEEVAAEGETVPEEEVAPTNARAKAAKVKAKSKPVLSAAEGQRRERERATTIQRLCSEHGNPTVRAGGKPVPLAAHAVAAGWSVGQVKTQLLNHKRATRPTGPAIISKSHDRDATLQAFEGAMILRAGGKLDSKTYQSPQAVHLKLPQWLRAGINDATRNRIMEAAHRYSDLSAVDLCKEALRLDRKDCPHSRQEMIQAAFSGSALTNIFTTNVNAVLLATYLEAPDTTMGWVSETDVADYKLNERPRMTKSAGLSKLPRGGEADHASRSDVGESYKIARYAKQFVIDEMDVINDSLGALADMPQEMALAAARLRPDLVYAIMLDNPALTATARDLFNATDGNLLTTAALASATLRAAIKAMQLFRENAVNLNLAPTHLIVPPALKHAAAELINSATIFKSTGTNATVEFGSVNPIQEENLTRVVDARLENGVVDPDSGTTLSGSASTWWLVSNQAHTIEVGYLRGTGRAPQVRPFTLDKGQYGVGWDVQMSIGAKGLDWKGFVQNTA